MEYWNKMSILAKNKQHAHFIKSKQLVSNTDMYKLGQIKPLAVRQTCVQGKNWNNSINLRIFTQQAHFASKGKKKKKKHEFYFWAKYAMEHSLSKTWGRYDGEQCVNKETHVKCNILILCFVFFIYGNFMTERVMLWYF